MPQPLFTFVQKTNTQIRDDILRTIKNGLIAQGVANPNIGPGSDYYISATAFANELAVVQANSVIQADQLMPDTAAGVFLDRWLATFGLARRAAIGSSGVVTITTSVSSTLVVQGTQLTDSIGQRYQVTVGGSYGPATTSQVPIAAIDTGKNTNHINGDTLTWVNAPAFTQANVSVGTPGLGDGLTGGADSEVGNDEPPRARLFQQLQNPPKGGNAANIALWAAQSNQDVQAAFVYPALLGPGTVFFCVTQAPNTIAPLSSNSKNRDIPAALVNSTIVPYVLGNIPEHVFCVGATPLNQPTDVAIQLSLPAATTASPAGPGGGWLDGTPWPQSIGGTAAVSVTSVSSSTIFTVNAATPPTPGVSRIAWLSPLTWTLNLATVTASFGTSGTYAITIDTPMPGIAAGNFIFPQSTNQQTYVNALLGAFALMGPGEWTINAGAKIRAYRRPLPTQAWPYALGATQLKAIISSGTEVLDASYISRSSTTPNVPATVLATLAGGLSSSPPSILVPRNIGFYAI